LNLPYVAPIMHQAKALAATLTGTPTPLAYPPMPVVVKTPACPVIICPPRPDAEGKWDEEVGPDGARALFADAAGNTLGFVLLGARVTERASLIAVTASLLAENRPS
jgi:rubredoxin-NAD+ reductase